VKVWIALLRGINVSAQKIIKMEDLRKAFTSLHYKDVSTYIQSGNVVFAAGVTKSEDLRKVIEKKLIKTFGFEIPVIVRGVQEIVEVIKRDPFKGVILKDKEKIYVTFLSHSPTRIAKEELMGVIDPIDEISFAGSEVYLRCRSGYAKTLFSNTFIEKKLGVVATTRNWATVNKLLEIGNTTLKSR